MFKKMLAIAFLAWTVCQINLFTNCAFPVSNNVKAKSEVCPVKGSTHSQHHTDNIPFFRCSCDYDYSMVTYGPALIAPRKELTLYQIFYYKNPLKDTIYSDVSLLPSEYPPNRNTSV